MYWHNILIYFFKESIVYVVGFFSDDIFASQQRQLLSHIQFVKLTQEHYCCPRETAKQDIYCTCLPGDPAETHEASGLKV